MTLFSQFCMEFGLTNPREWSDIFGDINSYMRMSSHGFNMHLHDRTTTENIRDSIRNKLNVMNDNMFPMG